MMRRMDSWSEDARYIQLGDPPVCILLCAGVGVFFFFRFNVVNFSFVRFSISAILCTPTGAFGCPSALGASFAAALLHHLIFQ